ncbi:MAG TPA: SDR family NAD(P)-dependent oxidoreductase [Jatrophihabitans sp.]
MINALGAPQSVLVLGATSDIAAATVTRLAAGGRLHKVVLAARDPDALSLVAEQVQALGVPEVVQLPLEARDPRSVEAAVSAAFAGADIDVVLVAIGMLPDQQRTLARPELAVCAAQVNFIGAGVAALHAANALRRQGHGVLVVLSSAAAERPRRSNFVYGATKAGLDALCTGLGDELHGTGVSVVVVRPGFVRTKMTAHLPAAPLAITPEAVAEAIATHLTVGSCTVWVPRTLRPVLSVLRHLPRPVFRRLPV